MKIPLLTSTNTRYLKQISAATIMSLTVSLTSQSFAQTTIYEESFNSGLGSFTGNGRVYTGSYGARMRGGANSAITSNTIDLEGYTDITLSYDREAYGLDYGESFTVSYSANGGSFVSVESARSASGRTTVSLPAAVAGQTIQLRVSLNASSFFEYVAVDSFVLEAAGNGDDDDDDDNGNGTLPPVDRIDVNGPFQTTEDRNAGPSGDGWVVHPTNLGANGLKHPIFIWGPGGGTGPADYDFFLDRVASHGFVIYSEVSTGGGGEMEDALDWLIAENNRPGSIYYQKLDTTNIAAGGHSLGSISTFAIADDPRLTTTVHVAGGSFDGNGPDNLRNPALYVGGTEDFATGNMERDYTNTDVPVFFTILDGVDHIMATREGQPVIVAWLRWQLGGENFRSDDFLDTFCTYCSGIYDSDSKNW